MTNETAPSASSILASISGVSASARTRTSPTTTTSSATVRESRSPPSPEAPCRADSSTLTGEIINGRQLWFNYDHEGRMTLAGKTIEQDGTVTDAGVVITYDAAGRRATTLTRGRNRIKRIQIPIPVHTDTESWDQSRLERYTYNDLGYLTKIEQAGVRSNKRNLANNTPDTRRPRSEPLHAVGNAQLRLVGQSR